jgi:hypothetical protein
MNHHWPNQEILAIPRQITSDSNALASLYRSFLYAKESPQRGCRAPLYSYNALIPELVDNENVQVRVWTLQLNATQFSLDRVLPIQAVLRPGRMMRLCLNSNQHYQGGETQTFDSYRTIAHETAPEKCYCQSNLEKPLGGLLTGFSPNSLLPFREPWPRSLHFS